MYSLFLVRMAFVLLWMGVAYLVNLVAVNLYCWVIAFALVERGLPYESAKQLTQFAKALSWWVLGIAAVYSLFLVGLL